MTVEHLLQTVAVVLLVPASALFAAWRLFPARLKLRWLDRLKPDTGKFWGRSVARLRSNVAAELMHGCGACAGTPAHLQKHQVGQKAGPKV